MNTPTAQGLQPILVDAMVNNQIQALQILNLLQFTPALLKSSYEIHFSPFSNPLSMQTKSSV